MKILRPAQCGGAASTVFTLKKQLQVIPGTALCAGRVGGDGLPHHHDTDEMWATFFSGTRAGWCTDTGCVTRACGLSPGGDVAVIEANHDEDMCCPALSLSLKRRCCRTGAFCQRAAAEWRIICAKTAQEKLLWPPEPENNAPSCGTRRSLSLRPGLFPESTPPP
jgi:hypothetical protein